MPAEVSECMSVYCQTKCGMPDSMCQVECQVGSQRWHARVVITQSKVFCSRHLCEKCARDWGGNDWWIRHLQLRLHSCQGQAAGRDDREIPLETHVPWREVWGKMVEIKMCCCSLAGLPGPVLCPATCIPTSRPVYIDICRFAHPHQHRCARCLDCTYVYIT